MDSDGLVTRPRTTVPSDLLLTFRRTSQRRRVPSFKQLRISIELADLQYKTLLKKRSVQSKFAEGRY